MTLIGATLDYTDRDFASLKARIRSLIVSVYPDWTDDKVANFANLLMEMPAFVGDMLSFYQDNQAREAFLTYCQQRKNALAHCKRLAYKPKGPAAATVDLTFALADPVPGGRIVTFNPPFPPGAINPVTAQTTDADSPQSFELVSSFSIAAGESAGVGTVKNSVKQGQVFSASGAPNQQLLLSGTPFIQGSIVLKDDISGNEPWEERDVLLGAGSLDRYFTVTVDENDAATVTFGDGLNGMIPSGTIHVVYETGGGAAGNVPARSITKLDGSFVDSANGSITVRVSNAARATGGGDRQTIQAIREQAPVALRANDRCICREDFEIYAIGVPGNDIARALMLTQNEDPIGINYRNQGNLYIVPTNVGFPTQAQRDAVLTAVTETHPCNLTFQATVVDPIYLDVGIEAKIYLAKGAKPEIVGPAIVAELVKFFALTNADGTTNQQIDFGWKLYAASAGSSMLHSSKIALSRLQAIIQDVAGVREIGDGTNDFRLCAYRVRSTSRGYTSGSPAAEVVQALSHSDVPIAVRDFPRLKAYAWQGSVPHVVLTNGDTNAQIYPPVS